MIAQKHEQTFYTKTGRFIKTIGIPDGKGKVKLTVSTDMGRVEFMELVVHLRKNLPDIAALFEMHAPKE